MIRKHTQKKKKNKDRNIEMDFSDSHLQAQSFSGIILSLYLCTGRKYYKNRSNKSDAGKKKMVSQDENR